MSDNFDDLLDSEGLRWRDTLGPDPQMAALMATARRRAPRLNSLLVAAAVIVVLALGTIGTVVYLTGHSRSSAAPRSGTGEQQASCVSPVLGVTQGGPVPDPGQHPSIGRVVAGRSVIVYGRWYYGGPCQDTATTSAQPITSATPAGAVSLSLTTSDGKTRTLATEHPGRDAAFTANLTIPVGVPDGRATISDDSGHTVDLVIVSG